MELSWLLASGFPFIPYAKNFLSLVLLAASLDTAPASVISVSIDIVFVLWLAFGSSQGSPMVSSRRVKWTIAFSVIVVIPTPFTGAVGANSTVAGKLLHPVTIWMAGLAFFLVVLGDRLAVTGHPLLSSAPRSS